MGLDERIWNVSSFLGFGKAFVIFVQLSVVIFSRLSVVVFAQPSVVISALDVAVVRVFLVFFGGGAASILSTELPFSTEGPASTMLVVAFCLCLCLAFKLI